MSEFGSPGRSRRSGGRSGRSRSRLGGQRNNLLSSGRSKSQSKLTATFKPKHSRYTSVDRAQGALGTEDKRRSSGPLQDTIQQNPRIMYGTYDNTQLRSPKVLKEKEQHLTNNLSISIFTDNQVPSQSLQTNTSGANNSNKRYRGEQRFSDATEVTHTPSYSQISQQKTRYTQSAIKDTNAKTLFKEPKMNHLVEVQEVKRQEECASSNPSEKTEDIENMGEFAVQMVS